MGISDRFLKHRKAREVGLEIRRQAAELHSQGKSNKEIADILGIPENNVRTLSPDPEIKDYETIWFPQIYGGRQYGPWTKAATRISFDHLVALVQKRAKEDGEWAIANGHVGDNEDKMRRMMAFVSNETNIRQCLDHIVKEEDENTHNEDYEQRTVDYVCRDLANASKWNK